MTTETAQAGQDDRAKIWAEMDASDTGKPVPAADEAAVEKQPAATPAAVEGAKPEAGQAAAAPAASAADAGATTGDPEKQQLLDKVNGLESQLAGALKRVRNVEGRFGELNAREQAARDQAAAAGGGAPSAQELRAAQADPAKMAALKRDYPEFGAAMEAALNEGLSGIRQQITTLEQRLAQGDRGVTKEDVQALRNELQVENVHAGWQTTVRQPEFAGWLHRQPREVQLLAASDSPQDAIRLLDLHAEGRKTVPNQNNRRLESAAAIPTGGAGSRERGGKPVEEMNKAELWRYLDQQDAQRAQQQG